MSATTRPIRGGEREGREGEALVYLFRPLEVPDLPGFGRLVARLLSDRALAAELGAAARTRVQRAFLPDRHLVQYATLVSRPDIVQPAAGTIASRS